MKKVIKKLNRMYKELQPYSEKGCFLLGDSMKPCMLVFYGLPPLYLSNEASTFSSPMFSDVEIDVLINNLCDTDYNDFLTMTCIVSSYLKAIYKFCEQRSIFDSMVESGKWGSKKVYRVAMFRREPSYDYENGYHNKWQEIIDEKLSQSENTAQVSVEDTTQKMEQKVSKETASA